MGKKAVLKRKKATEVNLDKIRGCMLGGAIGDAPGYPVEFVNESQIFFRYGVGGIQVYELDPVSGKALISDDTQMSLFTANGILVADTRASLRGIGGMPHAYISMSYQDWLYTQEVIFSQSRKQPWAEGKRGISWIMEVPELYRRRAPGSTYLSALAGQKRGR